MSNLEIDAESFPSLLLHSVALRSAWYGWTSLHETRMNDWVINLKGGHSNYLTIWALALSSAAFAILVICQLVGLVLPGNDVVLRLKRSGFLLRDISLPLSAIVTGVYGFLILLARAIVAPFFLPRGEPTAPPPGSSEFPDIRLFFLPISTDLAVHFLPFVFVALSTVLRPGRTTAKHATLGIDAVGMAYVAQIERCAKYNHRLFPYPFLTASPGPLRHVIYIVMIFAALEGRLRIRKKLVAAHEV